ncbi:MAG: hypothetical protein M3384_17720 [Acidobacteriota bacterium]|nr:hypothetical protein [Acidobacteriota bacterium]
MQNIELQDFQPPRQQSQQQRIESYIKNRNQPEKIAGLFYYSSAAILWTMGVLFLISVLFSGGYTLILLILSLIYVFPVWVWAGIGVFLFRCHREYYKFGVEKNYAVWMWLLTAGFNAIQATFILNFLDGYILGSVVGGWNLIVASLSLLAFYFDMKKA